MISRICLLTFCVCISLAGFSKEWHPLTSATPTEAEKKIVSSSEHEIILTFKLNGFYTSVVETPAGDQVIISSPGTSPMLQAAMPDVTKMTTSVIIPDRASSSVEVISSDYNEYSFDVAPSKGNLKRNTDPASVPFTFGEAYQKDEFYPGMLASVREPYILRDFRGQAIIAYPFQYNPVSKTLRVYKEITVKVSFTQDANATNVLMRAAAPQAIDPTFGPVYSSHFENFNQVNYAPLSERGSMLVIAHSAFMQTMKPFIDWKNRMGQFTELVDVASIGTDPDDIKDYIENYYHTNGLTYVLLVGDGPQIPPYISPYGDSDPSYGFILGNDSYAEVIVGRFSAQTEAQLLTQVERTLKYEMNPAPTGAWYRKAVVVASEQGPGDDGEMDYEHEQNIKSKYLGYNYTYVDELYDGSQGGMDANGDPDEADLLAILNDGRSVYTYTGHGSTSSFSTTGFGISDVNDLTNVDMLPYIWSVACVNGDFKNSYCLAEALMQSTDNNGDATGAIATLMATINQSWSPPMDAQDEMVDLLTETYPQNVKHTFGGISVNGCMHMNDEYGSDGDEMTDTWNLFGDPSLMVRSNTPQPVTASHAQSIDEASATWTVNCPVNEALVCLSKNNQIVATAFALSGSAVLQLSGLTAGDTLDLTITGYNRIPYMTRVPVTNMTTGISATEISSVVGVYPNPANGMAVIRVDDAFVTGISIFNAAGQLVRTFPESVCNGVNELQFDVSKMPSGMYSVRVNTTNGVHVNRFIVN